MRECLRLNWWELCFVFLLLADWLLNFYGNGTKLVSCVIIYSEQTLLGFWTVANNKARHLDICGYLKDQNHWSSGAALVLFSVPIVAPVFAHTSALLLWCIQSMWGILESSWEQITTSDLLNKGGTASQTDFGPTLRNINTIKCTFLSFLSSPLMVL